jgi:hypothetical protein
MPDDLGFREYRARRPEPQAQSGAIGLGLLGIAMGAAYMLKGGAPLWAPLLAVALVAVPVALAKVVPQRSWTATDAEHLTVRRPLRSRAIAWRDIQAIELDRHWNGAESVSAYDADGRRVKLPHVNSWSMPTFHAEVARLRATWAELRGDDWAHDSARFED